LQTALIAVPNDALEDWLKSYETLAPNIVPRASEIIASDRNEALVTLTFFKRNSNDLKNALRATKFVIRELDCSEAVSRGQSGPDSDKLRMDERTARNEIHALIGSTSKQCVYEHMLISCLRVYLESVLRFGLPHEFSCYSLTVEGQAGIKALHDFVASQNVQNSGNDLFTYENSMDEFIHTITLMSTTTLLSAFAVL
jgi:V-type H+-transporting ATPase subunit C